ncbi:probable G-protein coupled receptor 152 [Ochotona princeps]|uniref:probable G-protein coupled receptor 152 n=1 Tax=Ochotona princeps TaxID=9978 RepID=UPI002715574B|nr:probable G-protein coupled receptor 152 [Ochotona princeps]
MHRLVQQVRMLHPAVPWRPQLDTAMEAYLGAADYDPHTQVDDDEDNSPQGGWDTVFLVALLLLGLPANGLMAWLAGSQARHGAGTRLALLLLSLALSDFLFLAAAAFQILELQHGGHWPLGTAACRFYYFLWGVSYSSGLFLLAALSLDRCLLALCPRWYLGRRPARLPLWVSAGVWVLATLFSVPWLVFPEATVWWYDLVICLDFWDSEELPLRMLEVLGGFLPFLLLLVCHVLTQAKACRPCRRCCCCRRQPQPPVGHGFARVAETILSAYVVLRLPYQLAQLFYLAFLWDLYPGYLLWEALVYSDYLILLDSCLSPFLCVVASADLRALLRALLSSFAAALCEEQPGSFTLPQDPHSQEATGAVTPPGPEAGTQLSSDSVAQPPVNPTAQPPANTSAQVYMDSTAQPPTDSVVQTQINPVDRLSVNTTAQLHVNATAQPHVDPPAQAHVDPTAQPPSDSVVQPQPNTQAQTSEPMAGSAPGPDAPASPIPSSDPILGTPEAPAEPAAPEGHSLSSVPLDEAPSAGPT